ncbi:hypothetical protein ATS76_02575 [Pseudoalteromonas sp. 10-33]|nr:hypothetical protein ATS76_02575 [Pseudoalteromonas sp. 10-33]
MYFHSSFYYIIVLPFLLIFSGLIFFLNKNSNTKSSIGLSLVLTFVNIFFGLFHLFYVINKVLNEVPDNKMLTK